MLSQAVAISATLTPPVVRVEGALIQMAVPGAGQIGNDDSALKAKTLTPLRQILCRWA